MGDKIQHRDQPKRNLRYHRELTPSDTEVYHHSPDAIRVEGSANAKISLTDRSGKTILYKLKEGFSIIDILDVYKINATDTSGVNHIVGGYYEEPPDPLTEPEV